jgi:hypothetical protein
MRWISILIKGIMKCQINGKETKDNFGQLVEISKALPLSNSESIRGIGEAKQF